MSSDDSFPPCAVDVHSSHTLFALSSVLAVIALACPWIAGLPPVFAALVSLLALPPALPVFRWARGELSRFVWHPDGRWQLKMRTGAVHDDAKLLPGIWLTQHSVALRWRCRTCGRRFRVLLLADNCDAQALRRLRVRLRVTPDAVLFAGAELGKSRTSL